MEDVKKEILTRLRNAINGVGTDEVTNIFKVDKEFADRIYKKVARKLEEKGDWLKVYADAIEECNNVFEIMYVVATIEFLRGYIVGRYDQLAEDIKRLREIQSLTIGQGGGM